jgi:hypothetical protein
MRTLTLSLSVCLLTSCRPAAQPPSAPQPEDGDWRRAGWVTEPAPRSGGTATGDRGR